MYGEETLDAVDARELSVCTDDLCETAVDVRADLPDTRPGILRVVLNNLSRISTRNTYFVCLLDLQAKLQRE